MCGDVPLSVRGISKIYDEQVVLHNVGFDLHRGDVCALLGVNGSGKTTLLKTIVRSIYADDGEIRLFGIDNKKNISRKYISYMPEKLSFSPMLKGMECLSVYGINVGQCAIYDMCEYFEFPAELLYKKISQYSRGMRQKLGLILTLLSDTPIIILDEPMNGLDCDVCHALARMMKKLSVAGKIVLFSSHMMLYVERVCNKIIVLNDTTVVYEGTPQNLISMYNCNYLESAFIRLTKNECTAA